MELSGLAERLARIEAAIARACADAERPRAAVRLVAVSKTHPPEAIAAAYALGLRDFGESYAQELRDKRAALAGRLPGIRWHFIGRVQRNKVRYVHDVHLVHGVGTLSQAAALGQRGGQPVEILLQVNEAGEEQKNGFSPAWLRENFDALSRVPGVHIRGLMTLPPLGGDARRSFSAVRALRDELVGRFSVPLPELSMGMSGDFPAAIAEGATLVRIGSALFGPRPVLAAALPSGAVPDKGAC